MLFVLLLACSLVSACGKSNTFTVNYVGTPSLFSVNLFIDGKLGDEKMNIWLRDAFKGCTVTEFNLAGAEMSGTEEGYMKFNGGVVITVEDESGRSHEITIKEGSTFSAEKDGDTVRLLPPA